MKYYSLKYVSRMDDGFGGNAKTWKIKILEKYRGDEGLLEHEKFHVRQWYYGMLVALSIAAALFFAGLPVWFAPAVISPWVHGLLYRNKYYRRWSEIRAYRIQLKKGSYHSPRFAVDALMYKYSLGMSERQAKKALGID